MEEQPAVRHPDRPCPPAACAGAGPPSAPYASSPLLSLIRSTAIVIRTKTGVSVSYTGSCRPARRGAQAQDQDASVRCKQEAAARHSHRPRLSLSPASQSQAFSPMLTKGLSRPFVQQPTLGYTVRCATPPRALLARHRTKGCMGKRLPEPVPLLAFTRLDRAGD